MRSVLPAALVEGDWRPACKSGPITSTFRWEGKIQTAEEWICVVKTPAACIALVEAAIRELHPYQVPEIVATPVVEGSQTYLEWLAGEVLTPANDHE